MVSPGSASIRPAARLSAAEAIAGIADEGSWREWPDEAAAAPGHGTAGMVPVAADYAADLAAARAATGCAEAVVVGEVTMGGVPAAILAWEFGFLGGSIGVATASLIVAGIRRTTRAGLPLLALPRSGGTRMQEGTPAFVQMTAITAALAEHRRAGLPYLVHLCHPTTGGVLATLGSAGDLTTAEPGALVGFLGPRAVAAITGESLTPGVQSAENLVAHGVVDHVLPWPALRAQWAIALSLWADRLPLSASAAPAARGRRPGPVTGDTPSPGSTPPEASRGGAGRGADRAPAGAGELWALVQASRGPHRTGASAWLAAHVRDRIELPCTNAGELGSGVRAALGRVGDVPIVVAGTVDRSGAEPLTAAGLRVVRRAVALAARWRLPVLTVVDTLGAQLSDAAETGGIAGEISRTMLDLVACPTPTVALLLGPGTGGAALALLPADRVIATAHSWVAPLPPEGAAAIRHHGSHDPAEIAWEQQVGAHALAGIGLVDTLVDDTDDLWPVVVRDHVVRALHEACGGVDSARRVSRFSAWAGGPPR